MARKTKMIAQIECSRSLLHAIVNDYDIDDSASVIRRALTRIASDLICAEVVVNSFPVPGYAVTKFNVRTHHDSVISAKLRFTQEQLEKEIREKLLGFGQPYLEDAAYRYLAQKGRLCLLKNTP